MSELETIQFEVIADFPCSMHKVGDVISVYASNGMAYVVEIDEQSEKCDLRDYPQIYRQIK
jgi:hypothetical protein